MVEAPSKDFNVAIIGGGMCGLACAFGLARAGIKVKIFEATAKFDDVGAGVSLGPNALTALKGIGLLDTILKAANIADSTQEGFRFVTGTGDHDFIYDVPAIELESNTDHEKQPIGIYRPTFITALTPLIDPETVSFNKRFTSITLLPSGQHRICFSDESTYDVDLVIGADGIKSTVRNAVVDTPGKSRVTFINTHAYRGIVSVTAVKAAGVKLDVGARPYLYTGQNKHMVTYPIQNHTLLNIAAMYNAGKVGDPPSQTEQPYPWVQNVDQQELLDAFKDFGSDAVKILQHVKQPSRWALHTIYPQLETYVKDRVVLIGDAAHAMLPYLAAGVGQGFEDVYVLCRLLEHPKVKKENLNTALRIYNTLRRPRANATLDHSLRAGDIPQSFGPNGYDIKKVQERLTERFESKWHYDIWHHDLEGEVDNALLGL